MSRHGPGSIGGVLHAAAASLAAIGIETPRLDCRVLMAHVLGCDHAWLIGHADEPLLSASAMEFAALLERRRNHEPIAYLTGHREFWSLSFQVTPDTLIPRPDSETLIETGLTLMGKHGNGARLLDLGTGSGCLLLALLHELPSAIGIGLDDNPRALNIAGNNAAALGLSERASFVAGSWREERLFAEAGRFELVLSNPPYIRNADMDTLAPDILRYEPEMALRAGDDGLDAYRCIARHLPSLLKPGGYFIGEFGDGQSKAVAELLMAHGLSVDGFRNDATGRERCVVVRNGGSRPA